MKATIIDGKMFADNYAKTLKERVDTMRANGLTPGLAVLLVGNNSASAQYVRSKSKRATELGIYNEVHTYGEDATEQELIDKLEALNADGNIHGILVQLPLPKHLDAQRILPHISPKKDVDGLHACNAGALVNGEHGLVACTPKGSMALIKSTGVPIAGKTAVVVGRSNMVGKPAALLLLQENATVIMAHSKTPDLGAVTRQADILVAAVGRDRLITKDMVKPGAVVIDIGMNRVNDRWHGDVDFEGVSEVASFITPVPGGVGPMTIIMLMENTLEAAEALANG